MATFVGDSGTEPIRVRDVWDDNTTPSTGEEWKRAFECIAVHRFKEWQDLGLWLAQLNLDRYIESETEHAEQGTVAANQAIAGLDRSNLRRARIAHELGRQMAVLAMLQQRTLEEFE